MRDAAVISQIQNIGKQAEHIIGIREHGHDGKKPDSAPRQLLFRYRPGQNGTAYSMGEWVHLANGLQDIRPVSPWNDMAARNRPACSRNLRDCIGKALKGIPGKDGE